MKNKTTYSLNRGHLLFRAKPAKAIRTLLNRIFISILTRRISCWLLVFLFPVFLCAQSDIQILKTVDQSNPSEDELIVYNIEVENDGPTDATGIQVLDSLPTGLTLISHTVDQGTYDPGTGLWNIGAVADGDKVELILQATVDGGGATSGSLIKNTATLINLDQSDPNASNNSSFVNIVVARPDIEVTKQVDDATPDEGQTIAFTIKAKNAGSSDAKATGLVITDQLPDGLTYVPAESVIPAGTTYDPSTGEWVIGTLLDGEERTLILVASVDNGQSGLMITNTAAVTAVDQPLEGNVPNMASVSLTVNFPDIELTKIVSGGPYNEGESFTYTVTVENLGPADASGLQIRDILPSVLTLVSFNPEMGTYDPGSGIWDIGDLADGDKLDLEIVAFPNTGSSGFDITNTATLFALDQNDTNIGNNSASVAILVATVDLLLTKNVSDNSPDEGQIIEFSIKIENDGAGDASNILIEDVLPTAFGLVGITSQPQGTTVQYDTATQTLSWLLPSLGDGSSRELKFEALVNTGFAAQTITNTATIDDFDQLDPNRANNTATVNIFINGADLNITKMVDNPAPNPLDTITFMIRLSNNGPLKSENIIVEDILPSGLTFISAVTDEGNYNPTNGRWTNISLNPAELHTLLIMARVDAGTTGSNITNTARIIAASQPDSFTDNNEASAVIAIGEADLGITKSVSTPMDGIAFSEGESFTYTLEVENYGPHDAPLVSVLDSLPPGVSYTSHSGGNYNPQTGIWEIGSLATNAIAILNIQATVDLGTAGKTIINSATVSSPANEPDNAVQPNTATVSFQVHGADLAISKITTATAPIVEGDEVQYVIELRNNGPDDATQIEVTDLLPLNLDFVSATSSEGIYDEQTGIWNGIALGVGETASLTIHTTVSSGGAITNTATITQSSEADAFVGNNSASVFISALKTFGAGACIINMGQSPQTYDNTLKVYGLLYELIQEEQIPVWWAIRPDKSFENEVNKVDQIDFSVNGIDYRTGAFIIDSTFVPFAQAKIDSWTMLYPSMQINCDQPAFEAPIHDVLTSYPKAVLDEANGGLIESAFYDNIGLENQIIGYRDAPTNEDPIYSLYRPDGSPVNLNACDDLYAMPHADPHTWTETEREVFDDYIKNGGWLWAACHAVSALETLVDVPSIPGAAPDMNFLSVEGLIEWGDHGDGTLPYSYSLNRGGYASEAASDPFMQFIGNIDEALQSGSEQIYIPFAAGWRSSTTIAMWDPDHPERAGDGAYPQNAAALLAYGRAFGNPDFGMIMYEASHSVASGSEAENVGAARVYGNFLLQASIDFRPVLTPLAVPDDLVAGQTASFSFTADGRANPLTYQWTSDCGGTFSDPNAPVTDYTPPLVDRKTTCLVRLIVTDACGRTNFFVQPYGIVPRADPAISLSAPATVVNGEIFTYTITVVNNGPSRALAVVVNDVLPTGLTLLSATPSQGSWTEPEWSLGNLSLGASATLELTVMVSENVADGTELRNIATVMTNSTDVDLTNNTATVSTFVQIPDLTATKSVTEPFYSDLNQVINYQISVENTGSAVLDTVLVEDAIADSVTSTDTDPADGFNDGDTNLNGLLDVGETWLFSATHTVSQADIDAQQISNIARASALDPINRVIADSTNEVIIFYNTIPVAVDDHYTLAEDESIVITPLDLDSDEDGDLLQIVSLNGIALSPGTAQTITVPNGIVNVAANGSMTFIPDADFNGQSVFPYTITDGETTASANEIIDVTPVNDPPIAMDDTYTLPEGTTLMEDVSLNDTDIDGPSQMFTVLTNVNNGALSFNFDGTFSYTPDPQFFGQDSFQYVYCDQAMNNLCDTAHVLLTIENVNEPPVITQNGMPVDSLTQMLNEDNESTVCFDISDPDLPQGDSLFVTLLPPANGTASLLNDSCVVYMPNPNFAGTDLVRKVVCDSQGVCDTVAIIYEIIAVNDAPLAVDDNYSLMEGDTLSANVVDNDVDPDGALIEITLLDDANNGTLNLDTDGSFTYTPDMDFMGVDIFTYQYCDGGDPVLCDTATVRINAELVFVRLDAKVLLQGALLVLDTSSVESHDTLMRDDLRKRGFIPLIEPYSNHTELAHVGGGGGETILDSAAVFQDRGSDAIVDWVLIELRDANNPGLILDTRAGLLQRDGDVVDIDGASTLVFRQATEGSYYVSIRHRNHLGAMTALPQMLSPEGSSLDFRDLNVDLWHNEAQFDGAEQAQINGKYALWTGNIKSGESVIFAGENNERVSLINMVLNAPGNFLGSDSFVFLGYHLGDVDLNGAAIFDGEVNDVDPIFNNVDGHPVNSFLRSQGFTIIEQLAK